MNDYQKLVREEAKAFYDRVANEFDEDAGKFGGKSDTPNLSRWIDERDALTERVQEISSKWGHKDVLWVQQNTRSKAGGAGGDPRGHAFASFLKDVRQEIKKLDKARRS